MQLTKLYEMQKELMDHIDYNGKDRFDKTVLALLVEVGECANEHRGFKYWSKNQQPSRTIHTTAGATEENAVEFVCADDDNCGERFDKSDARLQDLFGENNEDCPVCKNGFLYAMRQKNPLLEEYVDGLHFVLQLGIELGYEHIKPYSLIQISTLDVFRIVYKCVVDVSIHKDAGSYEKLLSEYLSLGYHLGFKNDDIYDAYVTKNEINHVRQTEGY